VSRFFPAITPTKRTNPNKPENEKKPVSNNPSKTTIPSEQIITIIRNEGGVLIPPARHYSKPQYDEASDYFLLVPRSVAHIVILLLENIPCLGNAVVVFGGSRTTRYE
jgi:hypothetical protein